MLGGSGSVPGRVAGADFDTPALYRLPIENSQDFPKRVLDLIIQTVGVMHHERWFRAFACDAGRPDWLLPSGVERTPSRECSHDPAPEYSGNYQSDYNSQKYNRHTALEICTLDWLGDLALHSCVIRYDFVRNCARCGHLSWHLFL